MVVHENAPRHGLSTRLPVEALLLNSEAHRQWRDLHYAADAGQDRFMTLIVTHPACLGHQMGMAIPNSPIGLRAMTTTLRLPLWLRPRRRSRRLSRRLAGLT